MNTLILDGNSLTLKKFISAIQNQLPVKISLESRKKIQQVRKVIDKSLKEKKIIYGITTGFGALSDVLISPSQAKQLQKNILKSHAAGVGPLFSEQEVRGILLLMINSKAKGYSGLRNSTLDTIKKIYNKGILPEVPEQGSVGASGDLAPLAHLSLVFIGRGKARYQGKSISGAKALKLSKIRPIDLAEGEGLALVNGTQVMTAVGALATHKALNLARIFDIAAAMSLEVLLGTNTQFHQRVHRIRPHRGQTLSAENMRKITRGSEIISSHKDCGKVQDAYSLRCVPQVHGASRDTLMLALKTVEIEMNSATENPLIFPDGQILSGGNFHGQPVALVMDHLSVAISELSNISERRIERMVNPQLSGLPSFLIQEGGLNSGFMIAQYTAAALVSENKALSHPASTDSIPTSANKEDHVSMGTIAARKARQIVENATRVAAIELMCAAQALDLFTNLKPGKGTLAAYKTIRNKIKPLKQDRELAPDMETLTHLISDGSILKEVEKITGPLP